MNRRFSSLILAALLLGISLQAQEISGYYIFELQGPPAAVEAAKSGRQVLGQRRAEIAGAHRLMRTAVERRGARVLDSTDTAVNALLVQATDAQSATLAAVPGVRQVYPVYEVRMSLDRALGIHQVDRVWSQVGVERAGLGIKIAIVDSGIDSAHPAFQTPWIQSPPGYPLVNDPTDREHTSNKVIVARNYERLYPEEPLTSARDQHGHGTSVAMIAAGARVTGPRGPISGAAPAAFLGNYKVFPGTSRSARSDVVLKAFDDAVRDGMDVINLSLGTAIAPRPRDNLLSAAIERAAALGIIVVAAAGNEGPDPGTIGDAAVGPAAIAVGAVQFVTSVTAGELRLPAEEGTGPRPSASLAGPLADVEPLDGTGLACAPLPSGSLQGRIALIQRGTCLFEEKLNNAQAAGAIGAIVYARAEEPDPIGMNTGGAQLPAVMVSHADGLQLKQRLSEQSSLHVTISFVPAGVGTDLLRLAAFSSRGPGEGEIKPDLVAVGGTVSTATILGRGGFTVIDGTSFSAPLVAGAAAVLKAVRPGLSAPQYRSLIINSASPLILGDRPAAAQEAGAGALDLWNALRNTLVAQPASLSFGVGGVAGEVTRRLTLTNIGAQADTFLITAETQGAGPTPLLSQASFFLEGGTSGTTAAVLPTAGLGPGQYQGVLRIRGSQTEIETRIPYWYGVPSGIPAQIVVLATRDGAPEARITNAISFRVIDSASMAIPAANPTVTVVSGGGEVVSVTPRDVFVPGLYRVTVQLGPTEGSNVFRIQAGEITRNVTLRATATQSKAPQTPQNAEPHSPVPREGARPGISRRP